MVTSAQNRIGRDAEGRGGGAPAHGAAYAHAGHSPASAGRGPYPFSAIAGQEEMKLSLILNVIDPKIGGVMIMGDRGTGKSTTIRALADLLPEIQVSAAACNT